MYVVIRQASTRIDSFYLTAYYHQCLYNRFIQPTRTTLIPLASQDRSIFSLEKVSRVLVPIDSSFGFGIHSPRTISRSVRLRRDLRAMPARRSSSRHYPSRHCDSTNHYKKFSSVPPWSDTSSAFNATDRVKIIYIYNGSRYNNSERTSISPTTPAGAVNYSRIVNRYYRS